MALNRLLVPPGAPVEGDYSVDADNTWADPPVVDTHAHAGWMQDYLFKQVSWTGIDNRRGTITSAVHTGLIMPNVPSMRIAALATFQAAVDLYGANSAGAVAIRQAMQAVGLMN